MQIYALQQNANENLYPFGFQNIIGTICSYPRLLSPCGFDVFQPTNCDFKLLFANGNARSGKTSFTSPRHPDPHKVTSRAKEQAPNTLCFTSEFTSDHLGRKSCVCRAYILLIYRFIVQLTEVVRREVRVSLFFRCVHVAR